MQTENTGTPQLSDIGSELFLSVAPLLSSDEAPAGIVQKNSPDGENDGGKGDGSTGDN